MSKEASVRYLPNEVIGVGEGELVFAGNMGENIRRALNRALVQAGQGEAQVSPLRSPSPVENNRIKHPEKPNRKRKRKR